MHAEGDVYLAILDPCSDLTPAKSVPSRVG